MKEKKTMTIMILVLVVLVAAFFGLRSYNDRVEKEQEQEEESARISITDISDLQSISYSGENGEISLDKEEDVWAFRDEPDVALTQSYIETMAAEIEDLEATREIEDPDELSYYGLDEPLYTVQANDGDGNSVTIYVGDGADSDYYLSVDEMEHIYTGGSSLVSSLQYTKNQLVENDTVPGLGTDQIKKVVIRGLEGGKQTYKASEEENEDAIATILGGINSLSFSECTAYDVSEDDLVQYGLDKDSRLSVTITYTDSTESDDTESDADSETSKFTLYIGNQDDTGTYRYVQVKGSKIVNTALLDTVNNLLNQTSGEE